MANLLIGTIDCAKTNVGSLVNVLLEDKEFFYIVMENLESLTDVNKMLVHTVLVPKKPTNGNKSLVGNEEQRQITARIASKSISVLVCIKSTLSMIPNFARVLEKQLNSTDTRDRRLQWQSKPGGGGEEESTAAAGGINESNDDNRNGTAEDKTESAALGSMKSITEDGDDADDNDNRTAITDGSSLLIGLGGGPIVPPSSA